jgi:hypothetical protein
MPAISTFLIRKEVVSHFLSLMSLEDKMDSLTLKKLFHLKESTLQTLFKKDLKFLNSQKMILRR